MIKSQKGFNLTELMVVIVIIGILGLITAPNIVTAVPGYRLKSAARDLCSNLRKARSLAVKQNRTITIEFRLNDNNYTIDGSDAVALAPGISFGCGCATQSITGESPPSDGVSFFNNRVSFNSAGIVSGTSGYVYLQNNKGQTYGVGARTSGSIVMRQWTGTQWK